jgi:hypothetical protein
MRFDTHGRREGVYTLGRFAQQRGRWRINNYGWNSEIDYVSYQQRDKPLIAIIGDSYIEAFQINVEDNIAAVLRRLVKNDYDVYSFGVSGEPLSQYLQMSRYVNRHFKPEVIVFNITHNDFNESIRNVVNKPYSLQLSYKNGEFLEVPPNPYKPNIKHRILRKSAFVRYLWLNLYMAHTIRMLVKKRSTDNFNANIDVKKVMVNREIIKNATFFLIKKIREENPDKELVFMIDAPRKDIYSGTIHNSGVLWLHDVLKDACAQNNCHFIDLTKPFSEKFNKDGIKFNSDYDGHWNEIGHKTAAQVLYDNLSEILRIHTKTPDQAVTTRR